jgi:NAD(P)-dependent dehydrogenase (short-subunit alcohol dehydrogenase family)
MSKSKRRTISGRTVVITGAASGIGRALAQRLSAHRCPVAIADIDEKGLKRPRPRCTAPRWCGSSTGRRRAARLRR